jgi:hypothetical protein
MTQYLYELHKAPEICQKEQQDRRIEQMTRNLQTIALMSDEGSQKIVDHDEKNRPFELVPEYKGVLLSPGKNPKYIFNVCI